eukprot:TRINITY_DN1217_c0_g1_i1.p1 TRINITY_DN1217_c0_g1~~TRINITY_DN1217_c0_g1_i1.p1  ORF type:complete len:546 (-),score=215.14 TRINITY_DN1217_c0_g1_i1:34-1671(-)
MTFSPDGRWLVSGSDDGTARLWDLTAGKQLHSFEHEGPITSLRFHPNEFVLATGSADKTVKFWDLENFDLISQTSKDSTGVRTMEFSEDGSCILVAHQESLKVWQIEPAECLDTVMVPWNNVAQLSITDNKLLGCTFNQTLVGVHVVNLRKVAPFTSLSSSVQIVSSDKVQQKVDQDQMLQQEKQKELDDRYAPKQVDDSSTTSPGGDGGDSSSVGRVKVKTTFTSPNGKSVTTKGSNNDSGSSGSNNVGSSGSKADPYKLSNYGSNINEDDEEAVFGKRQINSEDAPVIQSSSSSSSKNTRNNSSVSTGSGIGGVKTKSSVTKSSSSQQQQVSGVISLSGNDGKPLGLNPQMFLPQSNAMSNGELSDEALIAELMEENSMMKGVLSSRLTKTKAVHSLWKQGDAKGAIEALIKAKDIGVTRDVFAALNGNKGNFTLDTAADILPQVPLLLQTNFEDHILTGFETVQTLMSAFGDLIAQTRMSKKSSVGVDISMEERIEKCDACYDELVKVYDAAQLLKSEDSKKVSNAANRTIRVLESTLAIGL